MLSENIIEIDQSFVFVDASETDAEIFFQTVEKYLEERIQRQEDEDEVGERKNWWKYCCGEQSDKCQQFF